MNKIIPKSHRSLNETQFEQLHVQENAPVTWLRFTTMQIFYTISELFIYCLINPINEVLFGAELLFHHLKFPLWFHQFFNFEKRKD